MKLSNWRMQYYPRRECGQGFSWSSRFAKHAKAQTVDGNALERRLIKILGDVGFNESTVKCVSRTSGAIMKFEGGLCWYVSIPGNAAGLSLDCHVIKRLDTDTDYPPQVIYSPHNLDTPTQVVTLVAIMSRYINILESSNLTTVEYHSRIQSYTMGV